MVIYRVQSYSDAFDITKLIKLLIFYIFTEGRIIGITGSLPAGYADMPTRSFEHRPNYMTWLTPRHITTPKSACRHNRQGGNRLLFLKCAPKTKTKNA